MWSRRSPRPQPSPQPSPAGAGDGARGAGGGMREAIAAAMSRSKREIPHYYLSTTVDVTPATRVARRAQRVGAGRRAAAVRGAAGEGGRAHLPRDDGLQRLLSRRTLRGKRPRCTSASRSRCAAADWWRRRSWTPPDKPLAALMDDFRALVTRARAGRLRASELAAPTIILTSLGESSVDAVFPIIQPPQVAIVGAGAVVDAAVGRGRRGRAAAGADAVARRRSPRDGRAARCAVPGAHRRSASRIPASL